MTLHESSIGPESPLPPGSGNVRAGRLGPARQGVRWGRIVIVTIAVLFTTMAAAVGYFGVKVNQSVSNISRAPSAMPTGSRPPAASAAANTTYQAMNILLIGSDSRGSDTGRSDTFIILHIDADRKNVYLISFPRDMWVTIPGHGKAKINAGYSLGGPALAVSTIEGLTGARIDHVVITDFTDFVQLVDQIGPVTVDNPVGSVATDDRGVKYGFPQGPLVITDGYMALAFSRQRDELPRGDLDRTLRQRAFLKALALKIGTPDVLGNPVKLNAVIATVGKYVTVDSGMTNGVIYSLALSLTGITNADQIHMVQAPITGFATVQSQSTDTVDVPGNTALGKALQNDTMAAFVAAHPTTEYGYAPTAPVASAPATAAKATARAVATKKKKT